jgi:hypothetical protein
VSSAGGLFQAFCVSFFLNPLISSKLVSISYERALTELNIAIGRGDAPITAD